MRSEELTLVTTDLLETRPSKGKILFLGEWCKSFHQERTFIDEKHETIPYHWNDRIKLKEDFNILQAIKKSIFNDLVCKLNGLHNLNKSERYWEILIGFWLSSFISVMLDRYSSVKLAENYTPSVTYFIPLDEEFLAAVDTRDFIYISSENSLWNHALFTLIIKNFNKIKMLEISSEHIVKTISVELSEKKFIDLKFLLKKITNLLSNFFKKKENFFLMGTYLSYWNYFLLELSLKQIPLPRYSELLKKKFPYDKDKRNWILPIPQNCEEVEILIRKTLPLFIPKIFIEGYDSVNIDALGKIKLSTPQVFFTSNAHYTDDFFKMTFAESSEKGGKLIVGEHGGFGTILFNGSHKYELGVADSYITTGWSNEKYSNIIPLFNFRGNQRSVRPKKNGRALLVCGNTPRYANDIRSMVVSSQMISYFEDQFSFFGALPKYIQSDTLVRLYSSDYGWDQMHRWQDRFPEVHIDRGEKSIWKLVSESRILISTYNSTAYIESFSRNFPTLIYWDPMYWEVTDKAVPYFDALKKAGIFHSTPESAARYLELIWQDIEGWWWSKPVQQSRQDFCNIYSAKGDDPVRAIKALLIDQLPK